MIASSRLGGVLLVLFVLAAPASQAQSGGDSAAVERAKAALAAGNAKAAYSELIVLQDRLTGQPEYDYLLGVASLDSGRIDEAIIAFERVLAVIPNHAGAQMDIARAYYAAGSFDLAQAAFTKLRLANPPRGAQEAIDRYLDAIQTRKHQTQAGWTGYGELGLGYDSNITGVPLDFGSAALQSFNLIGIEATGNSVKRKAGYIQGAAGAEYSKPLSRGWSVFAGGDARGRAYHDETDFNSISGEARIGAALNSGQSQWRTTASYLAFNQEGAAPGEPKPTNDRRMGGLGLDWRHALDTKTQLGLNIQGNAVRFPTNEIEDFDQIFVGGSWLKSFERPGVPLLYVSVFGSYDRAPNKFADGVTSKSKNLFGGRGYFQYTPAPKTQLYGGLGLIQRRDRDDFARSTTVAKGKDTYGEASIGLGWQFRESCSLRLQYIFSKNSSNIDIYDYDRHEISSTIRCEMF